MREIEASLAREIGLDVEALGRPTLERIVRCQMQRSGSVKIEDYVKLIQGSQAEWEELVESTVVTETWFFRDVDAFAGLARFVFERWLPEKRPGPLRLLSLPCASGEEPYSIAMTLLDTGLPASRFEIDAVDLSVRVLLRAQQGMYGRNAFRTKDLGFRSRYFSPTGERFVLRQSVRDLVRFRQANALASEWFAQGQEYDCIFCRNLLIYLDEVSQAKALTHIQSVLRPGGILFVGPAEQVAVLNYGFTSGHLPMGFQYPHPEAATAVRTNRYGARLTSRPPSAPEIPRSDTAFPGSLARTVDGGAPPGQAAAALGPLQEVKRLADGGRLQEAEVLCEAYLQTHRDCAEAYYLLGLVRDTAGRGEALDCYRKALYLEPQHRETLLQMALYAERTGDLPAAANLRRRARRAAPEGSDP